MSIYTKTGDDGTTALFDGARVSKSDTVIAAYGALDEVTSWLGIITTYDMREVERELLFATQHDMYSIMGAISNAPVDLRDVFGRIEQFETHIDRIQNELPELRSFVYPRGSRASVWCHVARCVCRRAERELVRVKVSRRSDSLDGIIRYVNRLSDYLFALGRLVNVGHEEKIGRMLGRPPRRSR